MLITRTISGLVAQLNSFKASGKTIGFVPTMGALHSGHISLINAAKKDTDIVVCSIFVNPTQFDDPADLEKYPRTLEADEQMLHEAGCDLLFTPSVEEMYAPGETWNHDFGNLEEVFEGAFRKGHFQGVGQVVHKLISFVQPDRTYFGQKDYQQFLIISRMVNDFRLNTELICCPIIREPDGLAMSSRNRRLSPEQRTQAAALSKTLFELKRLSNSLDPEALKQKGRKLLGESKGLQTEYLDIVNADNLKPITSFKDAARIIILAAVKIGAIRLIDNLFIRE